MELLQSLLGIISQILSFVYTTIPSHEAVANTLQNVIATSTKKLPEELQSVIEITKTTGGIIEKVQKYEILLP